MHFAAHCTARTTTCLKDVTNGGTAAAARIAGVVNWCLRKCSSENTHAASAPAHRPAQSSCPAHTAVTLSLLRLPRCHSPKTTNKSTKTIKAFLPPPHDQVKGFLSKMHSSESRFITGPLYIPFASMNVCTFQPRNSTGSQEKCIIGFSFLLAVMPTFFRALEALSAPQLKLDKYIFISNI